MNRITKTAFIAFSVISALFTAGCASTEKEAVSYSANPPVYSQTSGEKSVLFWIKSSKK